MDKIMEYIPFVWVAVAVIGFVLEALTTQMISIWFALGALCAVIPALMGLPFSTQLVIFVIISALLLIITRPLAKKILQKKVVSKTNLELIIGADGVVVEEINNNLGQGRVHVSGLDWTARSSNGDIIPKDAVVNIRAIEGVKVIVSCVNTVKV